MDILVQIPTWFVWGFVMGAGWAVANALVSQLMQGGRQ